jgi:L-ribulose-5-phosphate 3-epimerase UlaE
MNWSYEVGVKKNFGRFDGDFGHICFGGEKFATNGVYPKLKFRSYLISENDVDRIKKLRDIGILHEDVYYEKADSDYINSFIVNINKDTDVDGMIEVIFAINSSIDEIRNYKIENLFNEGI